MDVADACCGICLADFSGDDPPGSRQRMAMCSCSQEYHVDCINSLLSHNHHNCPTCRAPMDDSYYPFPLKEFIVFAGHVIAAMLVLSALVGLVASSSRGGGKHVALALAARLVRSVGMALSVAVLLFAFQHWHWASSDYPKPARVLQNVLGAFE